MSNNNSIWFAVDEDGYEVWFHQEPHRTSEGLWDIDSPSFAGHDLPPGAIQAITGRTLTWQDDPIEWVPGEVKNLIKLFEQFVENDEKQNGKQSFSEYDAVGGSEIYYSWSVILRFLTSNQ